MRASIMLAALTSVALSASAAHASQHSLTFTITNNTALPWSDVIFEIRPPVAGAFNAAAFEQIRFFVDPSRHDTTKRPVLIGVEDEQAKTLRFNFLAPQGGTAMVPQDGPISFRVMIDNPAGGTFRVGYTKRTVPAPAVAGLAAVAALSAARRRRPAA
ncbi:MAG: hypothetical protein SFZ24_08560 [Planctomycetota bacterium]|nr:hypothetical protein [Planctomycetota bacterium]